MTTLTPPSTGSLKVLAPCEMPLLREHLLRLDPESRRQRFNGVTSEHFVERYHSDYTINGTVVIAYIADGKMRGAAELHPPDRQSRPEIAFTVEKSFRSQGVGSILFERLIHEARKKGYDSLKMTTDGNNKGMKALARKFGVRIEHRQGEAYGILMLAPGIPTRTQRTKGSSSKAA